MIELSIVVQIYICNMHWIIYMHLAQYQTYNI